MLISQFRGVRETFSFSDPIGLFIITAGTTATTPNMLCYRFMLSQKVSSTTGYLKLYDSEIIPLLLRRPATSALYSTIQCTPTNGGSSSRSVSVQRERQEQDFIRSSRHLFHTSAHSLQLKDAKAHATEKDSPRTANQVTDAPAKETTPIPPLPLIDGETEKLGLFARFKKMYKEYWYVLLPVHVVTSAGWLGGFYYLSVRWVLPPHHRIKALNSNKTSSSEFQWFRRCWPDEVMAL